MRHEEYDKTSGTYLQIRHAYLLIRHAYLLLSTVYPTHARLNRGLTKCWRPLNKKCGKKRTRYGSLFIAPNECRNRTLFTLNAALLHFFPFFLEIIKLFRIFAAGYSPETKQDMNSLYSSCVLHPAPSEQGETLG